MVSCKLCRVSFEIVQVGLGQNYARGCANNLIEKSKTNYYHHKWIMPNSTSALQSSFAKETALSTKEKMIHVINFLFYNCVRRVTGCLHDLGYRRTGEPQRDNLSADLEVWAWIFFSLDFHIPLWFHQLPKLHSHQEDSYKLQAVQAAKFWDKLFPSENFWRGQKHRIHDW